MSDKTTEVLGIQVPSLIELGPDTKEAVIGGVKVVVKRLKTKGRLPDGTEYAKLLRDPLAMYKFIRCFKEDRSIARDVAVDRSGKPVTDDHANLMCGVTLAQIERLLVFTCAKRVFKETAEKTGSGAQIPNDLKSFVAFDWQLPMLGIYAGELDPDVFRVLGEGVLLLRSSETLRTIAAFKPVDVLKAKRTADRRFWDMLRDKPAAVPGVALCNEREFAMFDALLGERTWDFFAGDQQLIVELRDTDERRLTALGRNIAGMSLETFKVLDKLPTAVMQPFMDKFEEVLGARGPVLLGDDSFAAGMLKDIVEAFKDLGNSDAEIEGLAEVADLKWTALKPKLVAWADKKHMDSRVARRRTATEDAQAAVDKLFG